MTTATEVEEVGAWLKKASTAGIDAAAAFTDVVQRCAADDDTALPLPEALALLGQAYQARRHVEWALEASAEALAELFQQVHYAEQEAEFRQHDADKREGDDGR